MEIIDGNEAINRLGIEKSGKTLKTWMAEGLPVFKEGRFIRDTQFEASAIEEWFIRNKATAAGGRRKYLQGSGLKKCSCCITTMPLEEFYRDKSSKDGRGHRCKKCDRKRSSEYQGKHREERLLYCKNWYKNNREKADALEKKHRSSFEGKARRKVIEAVSCGKLIKPQHCENCGTRTEKEKLHGHHEDYNKALDVIWLCPKCHGLTRRKDN